MPAMIFVTMKHFRAHAVLKLEKLKSSLFNKYGPRLWESTQPDLLQGTATMDLMFCSKTWNPSFILLSLKCHRGKEDMPCSCYGSLGVPFHAWAYPLCNQVARTYAGLSSPEKLHC